MSRKIDLVINHDGLYDKLTELIRIDFFNIVNIFDDTITLEYYAAYHIIQMIIDVKNHIIKTKFTKKRNE